MEGVEGKWRGLRGKWGVEREVEGVSRRIQPFERLAALCCDHFPVLEYFHFFLVAEMVVVFILFRYLHKHVKQETSGGMWFL